MASLSLAKTQNRLIFLSIGYNACHCVSEPFLYSAHPTLLPLG
jgi:hypothetical protein